MNNNEHFADELERDRIAIANLQKRVQNIVERGQDRRRDDLDTLKRSIKDAESRRGSE